MASSKRESNQERTRLKEQIYEMMCIKHLPVIDVMKKTGLKKRQFSIIFMILRRKNVVKQKSIMIKEKQKSTPMITRNF